MLLYNVFVQQRFPSIPSFFMAKRFFPIALGALLVAYSAAALVFDTKTSRNGRADSALCRYLPCGDRLPAQARNIAWQPFSDGVPSALPAFQEALRRDPASPYRWSDLAEANLQAGFEDDARHCFRQAVSQGPHIPAILLRAANFHFTVGERQAALELGARCLAAFRDYDQVIFQQYLRLGGSLTDILRFGIPREQPVASSFFRFLVRQETAQVPPPDPRLRDLRHPDLQHPDPDGSLRPTWTWLLAHSLATPDLLAEYVSVLLRRGRFQEAVSVQAAFLKTKHGGKRGGNNLFNAAFDSKLSGSPLDWRISPTDHAVAARERYPNPSGSWALRLAFDGQANLDYSHVRQQVVVRPGRYRFQARVRAERLTTDQGIGFRILDPKKRHRLDIHTPQVSGTSDWKTIEKQLTIPPGTELVEIQIVRRPSLKFDNKIAGTAWIDDVSIVSATDARPALLAGVAPASPPDPAEESP